MRGMTREEAAAKVRTCLQHLRPSEHQIEYLAECQLLRPTDIPSGIARFVLCEILDLDCTWQPQEKVRWRVTALYKDIPVVIEDRKLGFALALPKNAPLKDAKELHKRLRGSTHIVTEHLRTLSRVRLEDGRFTLSNEFGGHDARYRYFRERARESYASPPPEPVRGSDPDGMFTWIRCNPLKPMWEGGHDTIAMVNEYFSRLEHLLILVLPSVPTFDPAGGRLRALMRSGWKKKYRAVFDLVQDASAKRFFDRLYDLKEALRNPMAHGGFLKDGASAWFHYEGIGALSLNLGRHHFARRMIDTPQYDTICGLFDELERFLDEHVYVGCGMSAVRAGMDVAFDPDSLRLYREHVQRAVASRNRAVFKQFVDDSIRQADAYANYED